MACGAQVSFACAFFNVSDAELDLFEQTYPGVPVEVELQKMNVWMWANPARRKKNTKRFICNWLSKTHGQLLAAQVSATTRELVRREQQRVDANVGKWDRPLAMNESTSMFERGSKGRTP